MIAPNDDSSAQRQRELAVFKRTYLTNYEVSEACLAAGIDFSTFDELVDTDPDWAACWQECNRVVDDRLAGAVLRRGIRGHLTPTKGPGGKTVMKRVHETGLTVELLRRRQPASSAGDVRANDIREMVEAMRDSIPRWAPEQDDEDE